MGLYAQMCVSTPYVNTLAVEPVIEIVAEADYKTKEHKIVKQYRDSKLGTNCVNYAKSKASVPNGMSTLSQKKSHIVSKEPEVGKVGVTNEGPVGHVVIVEEVHDDHIVISEGNYRHGYITWRIIPKEKILGYL